MEGVNKWERQMQLFTIDPDCGDYLPRSRQINVQ